jgi:hypothetical protein
MGCLRHWLFISWSDTIIVLIVITRVLTRPVNPHHQIPCSWSLLASEYISFSSSTVSSILSYLVTECMESIRRRSDQCDVCCVSSLIVRLAVRTAPMELDGIVEGAAPCFSCLGIIVVRDQCIMGDNSRTW